MPKMKSRSCVRKRFRATSSGRVKHRKAYTSHILTKKNRKRKRNLRRAGIANTTQGDKLLTMLLP
jgi:large subunit ribosomal protein L35